mmetsp:Transcript_28647/g.91379  ORF Transcript_28647/g.91379 Transcript_28647/m.91379 type:complete len:210 (+) Transcript_28647:605-1234(+)
MTSCLSSSCWSRGRAGGSRRGPSTWPCCPRTSPRPSIFPSRFSSSFAAPPCTPPRSPKSRACGRTMTPPSPRSRGCSRRQASRRISSPRTTTMRGPSAPSPHAPLASQCPTRTRGRARRSTTARTCRPWCRDWTWRTTSGARPAGGRWRACPGGSVGPTTRCTCFATRGGGRPSRGGRFSFRTGTTRATRSCSSCTGSWTRPRAGATRS